MSSENKPRHEIVAVYVDRGIRDDLTLGQIIQVMRSAGAQRREIRIAVSQVLSAQAWQAETRRDLA